MHIPDNTKVLVIYECVEPTNLILYDTMISTAEVGRFELKRMICTQLTASDINWSDVILSVRCTDAYQRRLSAIAKRLGKYWITMLDDDFFSLGKNYGKYGIGYRQERKINLKAILKKTDVLLSSNRHLLDKYSEIGSIKNTVLTDTPIDEKNLIVPAIHSGKTKIAFYVNDGTTEMFDRYIRPVMAMLCEKMSSNISLYLFALHPDLSEYEDKLEINYVPHMPYDEFRAYFASAHFDIGLMPLNDDGFSKYKYFNKYIEYTVAGIAGIYSDCELYRLVVTDGYNGILCDNTSESWFNAIQELVENPEKRKLIAENAQQYAREHLNRESIVNRLLADLPELSTYHAPEKKISRLTVSLLKIHYKEFRMREFAAIVWGYIRSGNGKLLFSKIKKRLFN